LAITRRGKRSKKARMKRWVKYYVRQTAHRDHERVIKVTKEEVAEAMLRKFGIVDWDNINEIFIEGEVF